MSDKKYINWGGARPNSGGRRKGAGSKPISASGEKLTRTVVFLESAQIERLRFMGKGNVSAGVRFLLDNTVVQLPDGNYHIGIPEWAGVIEPIPPKGGK